MAAREYDKPPARAAMMTESELRAVFKKLEPILSARLGPVPKYSVHILPIPKLDMFITVTFWGGRSRIITTRSHISRYVAGREDGTLKVYLSLFLTCLHELAHVYQYGRLSLWPINHIFKWVRGGLWTEGGANLISLWAASEHEWPDEVASGIEHALAYDLVSAAAVLERCGVSDMLKYLPYSLPRPIREKVESLLGGQAYADLLTAAGTQVKQLKFKWFFKRYDLGFYYLSRQATREHRQISDILLYQSNRRLKRM